MQVTSFIVKGTAHIQGTHHHLLTILQILRLLQKYFFGKQQVKLYCNWYKSVPGSFLASKSRSKTNYLKEI